MSDLTMLIAITDLTSKDGRIMLIMPNRKNFQPMQDKKTFFRKKR